MGILEMMREELEIDDAFENAREKGKNEGLAIGKAESLAYVKSLIEQGVNAEDLLKQIDLKAQS
jgi:hypothetical protein